MGKNFARFESTFVETKGSEWLGRGTILPIFAFASTRESAISKKLDFKEPGREFPFLKDDTASGGKAFVRSRFGVSLELVQRNKKIKSSCHRYRATIMPRYIPMPQAKAISPAGWAGSGTRTVSPGGSGLRRSNLGKNDFPAAVW